MESRRETLKIIGAIGTTCAFPFSAGELYGQHVHAPGTEAAYQPRFFSEREMALISRLAGLIIPRTDTPGAIEAGVPAYIDYVVERNPEHQAIYREGLQWLEERKFLDRGEAEQIALLTPLSSAVDLGAVTSLPEKFFLAVKSMTADGYFTSRAGLVDELGYRGNTVLEKFPECSIPEH
ncbi:MAG: gluconate 2-dehydrogenase subunit 3 family protein [Bryobacteraceae bacterium]